MSTQHTPGPWTAREGRTTHWIEAPGPFQIAEVYEGEANTRLIAAAPAMYALLVEFAAPDNQSLHPADKQRVRDVLRDVEGATHG